MSSAISVAANAINAFDKIDVALEIERKARNAMKAVGEQWMLHREAGCPLTKEERVLHEHLVRHWRRAAYVLDQLLERPMSSHP